MSLIEVADAFRRTSVLIETPVEMLYSHKVGKTDETNILI